MCWHENKFKPLYNVQFDAPSIATTTACKKSVICHFCSSDAFEFWGLSTNQKAGFLIGHPPFLLPGGTDKRLGFLGLETEKKWRRPCWFSLRYVFYYLLWSFLSPSCQILGSCVSPSQMKIFQQRAIEFQYVFLRWEFILFLIARFWPLLPLNLTILASTTIWRVACRNLEHWMTVPRKSGRRQK